MKKFLLLIFCVPILLLLGFLQTKHYTEHLKPSLKQEAQNLLESERVANANVSLDRLDASLEGVVSDIEQRKDIASKVSKIGGSGALRVKDSNNHLKVWGSLEMRLDGNVLHMKGDVSEDSPLSSIGQNIVSDHEHLEKLQDNVKGTSIYVDSPFLTTASFKKWLDGYFGFRGNQGFHLSPKDKTFTLFGSLTKELQSKYCSSVEKLANSRGLKFISEIKTIPSKAPTLNVERKNGQYKTTGVLSSDYEAKDLQKIPKHQSLTLDPYTHSTKGIDNLITKDWVTSYFSSNGDRSFSVLGDGITLAGVGTPLLQRQWLNNLKGFHHIDKKGMNLFPSEYHYPSYKVKSIKDKNVITELTKILSLNPIYFDLNSSQVKNSELPKINQISKSITAIAPDSFYIIGGHTDASGNIEMNLKLSQERAKSVIELLVRNGAIREQFSIVPFGSAKSTQQGSNATDRRVEILIK